MSSGLSSAFTQTSSHRTVCDVWHVCKLENRQLQDGIFSPYFSLMSILDCLPAHPLHTCDSIAESRASDIGAGSFMTPTRGYTTATSTKSAVGVMQHTLAKCLMLVWLV